MEETAESIAAPDVAAGCACSTVARHRRLELQRAVRSLAVVVLDVDAKDALKLAATDDQEMVEAIGAHRPHPTFCVRVGKRRRLRSVSSLRSELFG